MQHRNPKPTQRWRLLAVAAVTSVALASPVAAGPPECPCWINEIELMNVLPPAEEITKCDTHPLPNQLTGGAELRSEILTTQGNVAAEVDTADPSTNLCGGNLSGVDPGIGNLATPDAWKCIRDINAVCRGLGF